MALKLWLTIETPFLTGLRDGLASACAICAALFEMFRLWVLPPALAMPMPASSSTTEAIPQAAKRRSCVRPIILMLLRLLTRPTLGSGRGSVVGRLADLSVSQPADPSALRDRPIGR